jgi:hypothetical protein
MKTVKLNRRFRMFKEHGHTMALRFDSWNNDVSRYESACRRHLGSNWNKTSWSCHFGARNGRSDSHPYWITFRNEADLILVLLSTNLTKNA